MTGESVTLIPFEDRIAWEEATWNALPGTTWGHAAGVAVMGLQPQLAVVNAGGARMVLPFFQRSFRDTVDIATLPGLSGMVISPDSAAPLRAWSGFAQAQGWVAGYLQLSTPNDTLAVAPPDVIRCHNSLFVFDLKTWDIDSSIGYKMRRSMKAGDRMGARLSTDLPRLARAFHRLYSDNLVRIGGRPEFSPAAVARWFAEDGVIAFGAELDGDIVNIQMGRRHGLWADLHLAGATEAGRTLQAWVIWQAAEALRREGVRHFNIGGYGEKGDGLHWMKSRFGAQEHPLRAVLQVYDPDRFESLIAETGADPAGAWFPPYRSRT